MSDSYYGQPIIKPVEWTALIPAYFFCGGLAAGSALLAFGARRRRHHVTARRLTLGAAGAVAACAYCLIADLGRPARFHHMLRVFKPTSPMSVGTYIFTTFASASSIAAASAFTGKLTLAGRTAETLAAASAPALATYTAALIGDTAVPAWHEGRRIMPFLFAATSAASGGALGMMLAPHGEFAASRRVALAGAAGAMFAMRRLHAEVGPHVVGAYRIGKAARYAHAATAFTVLGIGAALSAPRCRVIRAFAGAALLAGAACERFAIFEAGRTASKDPKYTVELQRSRLIRDV